MNLVAQPVGDDSPRPSCRRKSSPRPSTRESIRQMLQRTALGLLPRPKRPLSPFARLRLRLAAWCPDIISQQSHSYTQKGHW